MPNLGNAVAGALVPAGMSERIEDHGGGVVDGVAVAA